MESVNGEQIKTVVEERTDESGRRIHVTRKIRMRLVQEDLSPAVAERRVRDHISLNFYIHIVLEMDKVWSCSWQQAWSRSCFYH